MTDPHAAPAAPQDEEPKTPTWLTAVGAVLFIGAAMWWTVTPDGTASQGAQAASAASASAAAAAAPNPQAQAMPRAHQAAPAFPPQPPGGSASAARRMVPPAVPTDVRQRMNALPAAPHP